MTFTKISTTFKNRETTVAGNIYLPPDFDEARTFSALVIATPGSSVKEQIGAIYAERLAKHGFVALTFDASYQGESTGAPRDLEDPAARVEDICCALDHLMTIPYVAEDSVGLLGICAGGGYAINAALTDHRFKAIATIVANDIGSAFRKMQAKADLLDLINSVGKQRTAEARGASERRDQWIPDSLKEADAAGITDPAILEAVMFYRESQYRHPNSTNRLLFKSLAHLLRFDAFHLVPELLIQPLLVIVGGRKGSTGQFEAGQFLFEQSQSKDKQFFVVDDAGHYDMYYKPDSVERAIERLVPFFSSHMRS